MVNGQLLGSGAIIIIVGIFFSICSFLLVDNNNKLTIYGFIMLLGGIVGIAFGLYVIYKGATK